MNTKIQFTKVRDVKSPKRANKHDAGTDFFIPNYTPEFYKDVVEKNKNNRIEYQTIIGDDGRQELEFRIAPNAQINIPSGIKVNILDKNDDLLPLVAADIIGAGVGETVLIVSGSSARSAAGDMNIPVDATVVGIVDDLEIDQSVLE